MRSSKAFTLLEVLIFLAIFSLVIVGFLSVFITVTRVQTRQQSATQAESQGQFLTQQIQYYIQTADSVNMTQDVSSSVLTLNQGPSGITPTSIFVATGTAYFEQGATGTLQALTSNNVTITGLTFTRHFNSNNSSSPFGTDSVSYGFTVTDNASNTTTQYSQSFQSSAFVQASVGKITLLQQARAEANTPSISSLAATFPMTTATGSLLVAVVANTTSSAVINASDTAGNTWNKIAIATSTVNTAITVFAALNAKYATDTVTVSLGAGAGYGGLYIYEYRGALTANSVDDTSTFAQASTNNPTSSSTTPLSGTELLFGATYGNPFTQAPVAGTGYTLETTSSITQTAIEDQTAFITGPEAATWNYLSTAPAAASVLVTFR